MRAHAEQGERGMAIQAYDRCRAVLADLLDAAPSRRNAEIADGNPRPGEPSPGAPSRATRRDRADRRRPTFDRFRAADDERRRAPRQAGRCRAAAAHVSACCRCSASASAEEDAYLAPGLADEITTALSRFRWMFVVSSSSLARFAQDNRDEAAIRRAFGIDFLLDGTIQRDRNRLRITMRLLDLRAGNQVVWARRFDRLANDLLTVRTRSPPRSWRRSTRKSC